MKPSPIQPVSLSLALWATASVSHAQLQPMVSKAQAQPELKPMNAATPLTGQLVSMAQSMEDISDTISATLQPMVSLSASPTLYLQPPLTAMAKAKPVAVAKLTSMEKHTQSQLNGPLVAMAKAVSASTEKPHPMVEAAPDVDITLTPLDRPGEPEIMRGRQNTLRGQTLTNPVPGIEPLTPPLQISPTNLKAVVLAKPGGNTPAHVVTAANGSISTTPEATFPANPLHLTDAELSPNPNIPTITRPEEELLAVDTIVNGIPRKSIIEVYLDPEQNLWLPLASMARLLEIPLSINAAAGVAQGWYQAPSNTLLISMAKNSTTVGAQSYPINGQVEKHDTDLFITASALEKWLGVKTALDFNQLQMRIITPNPLPGDIRAARLNQWDLAEKARQATLMPSDTIIPDYAKFSLPIVRLGFNTNYAQSPGADPATATGLTVQAENDIMGMNSNIALSLNQSSDGSRNLSGGSALLQKQSDNADLLGPLKARYFGIGDITTNPLVLSGLTSSGRGVRVSNVPRGAVNNPDQYVLTGPAPINWDVEVYQNQTLVGFSRIDATGTYRFTALPLRAGRNQFRIVLYGPNGERDERRENIYLGDNIPAVGEWQYDTAIYQPNQRLIPGLNSTLISTSALTTQAQLTTGLTSKWAATLGAFQTVGTAPTTNGIKPPDQGASAGLRGSMNETYFTADAFASASGHSIQSSLRTPLTDALDLRLTQTRNYGYLSDDRDELVTSDAELSYPVKLGKTALDTTYGYTHTTYQTQQPRDILRQRTAVGLGKVNATNELTYTTQDNRNQVEGKLEATTRVLNTSVRAGLTYQPTSPDPLRDLTLTTQVPVFNNQTLNLSYNQELTGEHASSLLTGINWQTGPWVVGVQGQAGSRGDASLGLNLATALVPQGYNQARWKLTPPNATLGQGQAAVRVFLDENANSRYDAGEPLIPNVTMFNRLRGTQAVTDAQGIAKFSDLSPNALNRISIDDTTLPDIYLKPVSDTLNVKPHVGDNGILNYAINLFGEISGQARTSTDQPIQNLTINLFNAKDEKIDSTITEYDGYYNFGALPMGSYTMSMVNSASIAPVTVTLTPKSRIQTRNLTINPK